MMITQHRTLLLMLGAIAFSINTHAVEPLSEEDMSDFALDSGLNLLNIYGPTAAGLRDDVDGSSTIVSEYEIVEAAPTGEDKQLEAAEETVKERIEDNENLSANRPIVTDAPDLTFEEAERAIVESETTLGNAELFDTSSEIRYRTSQFRHSADVRGNNDVIQSRDLQIDRLSLENLRSDDINDNSLGNIYLSDWQSRGNTRITVD